MKYQTLLSQKNERKYYRMSPAKTLNGTSIAQDKALVFFNQKILFCPLKHAVGTHQKHLTKELLNAHNIFVMSI